LQIDEHVSTPSPDRKALEEHRRQKLKDAELRLTFARQYSKEVQRDSPPGKIHNSDGNFAHRRASQCENRALDEYRRVLLIFNDLIVHGTIPDECNAPVLQHEA